jgi:hypothetical protein
MSLANPAAASVITLHSVLILTIDKIEIGTPGIVPIQSFRDALDPAGAPILTLPPMASFYTSRSRREAAQCAKLADRKEIAIGN